MISKTYQLKLRRAHIEEAKASILKPIGNSKFVISIPEDNRRNIVHAISNFEEVAQISPYKPIINVQDAHIQFLEKKSQSNSISNQSDNDLEILDSLPLLLGVLIADFFVEDDRNQAASEFESQGICVTDRPGRTKLAIDLSKHSSPLRAFEIIKNQIGLQSLEEKPIPVPLNDLVCSLLCNGVIPSDCNSELNNLSLTGKGEIVAIADSGLDTGDPNNIHPDFQGRVTMGRLYPIPDSVQWQYQAGSEDGLSDSFSGHGTHVAGSVLGNGNYAQKLGLETIPSGIAPQACLFFQSVGQMPRFSREYMRSLDQIDFTPQSSYEFSRVPDDLTELFDEAYSAGAKIHLNSWGTSRKQDKGTYSSYCKDLDKFVWDNKDFLVVVAVGNDGEQISAATAYIDQGSVTPLGTAKNCLTVGASETNRLDQFTVTYGNWRPSTFPFPHQPFYSDGIADSVDHIAAFSSRGPCNGGRFKPDVIAPGTFILSTRSTQLPHNEIAWAAYPPAPEHYMYNGGSSMAAPFVAGCAALVRQYLREFKQIDQPSAALIKAILIHSAKYLNYCYPHPHSQAWVDNEQGWGRIDLKQVLNPPDKRTILFIDESQDLSTGECCEYEVEIINSEVPLRITLVYTDFPGQELSINLNLQVRNPVNQFYFGNDFRHQDQSDPDSNVEGFIDESPEIGVWKINVIVSGSPEELQNYALVISGAILPKSTDQLKKRFFKEDNVQ